MRGISFLFPAILLLVGILCFLPWIGNFYLFEGEEVKLAEVSHEMVETGQVMRLQLQGKPFLENPPFLHWLQSLSMQAVGVSEFGARLPSVLFGCLTLLVVFFVGRRLHGDDFGLLWVLCFLSAGFPHLYYRAGLADPVFTFFFFLSVCHLAFASAKVKQGGSPGLAAMAGLFLGLAIMARGPVGLFLMLLVLIAYLVISGGQLFLALNDLAIFALSLLMTAMVWFGYEFASQGPDFLGQYLGYQISNFFDTGGSINIPAWTVWVLLFFGFFPASFLAFPTLISYREKEPADFRRWMLIVFFLALVLSFIFPDRIALFAGVVFLPVSYLAALQWQLLTIGRERPSHRFWYSFAGACILVGLALITLAMLMAFRFQTRMPILPSRFWELVYRSPAGWSGIEGFGGIALAIFGFLAMRAVMNRRLMQAAFLVAIGTLVTSQISLITVMPRIEEHYHGQAVSLIRSVPAGSAVRALGYTSYLPGFYGNAALLPDQKQFYLLHADRLDLVKDSTNLHQVRHTGAYVLFEKKR